MAECPLQVVFWSGDGHEALQDVLVENARWVFFRLVTHEAVDEGESSLRDKNASEGQVCEVWILRDGFCVTLATESAQDFEVVVCRTGVGLGIVELLSC